ncbi:MAG: DUF559 domain-containing protein [Myxococcota bacterium]
MRKNEVRCLKLAAERHGVLTRSEALEHLTRAQVKRRLAVGGWEKLLPGVYRVEGAPQTHAQALVALAAWAAEDEVDARAVGRPRAPVRPPRAALSHRTAAALHGFPLFSEGPLEVTCRRRLAAPEGITAHRGVLLPKDVVFLDGLPVTSIPRTLLDLAPHEELSTLRDTLVELIRTKTLTLADLKQALDGRKHRPAVSRLRALIAELEGDGGPTESELETASLELITAAGLPRPKVQWRMRAGKKRRRLDLCFPEQRVAIEADGYAWHSTVEAFEADRTRNNSLTARGYRVLHWTWKALQERPDELILELLATLQRPGGV